MIAKVEYPAHLEAHFKQQFTSIESGQAVNDTVNHTHSHAFTSTRRHHHQRRRKTTTRPRSRRSDAETTNPTTKKESQLTLTYFLGRGIVVIAVQPSARLAGN